MMHKYVNEIKKWTKKWSGSKETSKLRKALTKINVPSTLPTWNQMKIEEEVKILKVTRN